MRKRAYPKYKPSGVEWLGDVPEHWEVKRFKLVVTLLDSKTEVDDTEQRPYIGLENIASHTGRLTSVSLDNVPSGTANQFSARSTLFGKLRPYLAKALNPDFAGLCTTELLVLEPKQIDRSLLIYLLLSDGFIKIVDSSTYGAQMPRANWSFIGNSVVPIPSSSEQRTIAHYLDHETAKILTLAAKKRELIDRLKEERSALISQTVTKGLPADEAAKQGLPVNPPLKASGVEWLGDVPKSWEVKPLRSLTTKIGSGKTPRGGADAYQDEGILLIRSQNVHDAGLRLNDAVFIDEATDEEMSNTRVRAEDVLLNITGASLGRCCITPLSIPRANVNQHVCIIRLRAKRVVPRFIQRVLTSHTTQAQIFSLENGSSREGLNFNQIGAFVIAIPEASEQTAIADYLDRETIRIDALVSKVEEAIERLNEYRAALITAAVTGKIDVRDEDTDQTLPASRNGRSKE